MFWRFIVQSEGRGDKYYFRRRRASVRVARAKLNTVGSIYSDRADSGVNLFRTAGVQRFESGWNYICLFFRW